MKEWGFYVTRKREERRRLYSLPARFWPAALLAALLLTAGATQARPQNSGSPSSGSSGDLKTWEQLSRRFMTDLDDQSTELQQALTEIRTSEANSGKLTYLLEQSLKANGGLRNYNEQLEQRMRMRNEELAASYYKIGRLEKKYLRVVIALVAAVAAAVLLLIILIKRR